MGQPGAGSDGLSDRVAPLKAAVGVYAGLKQGADSVRASGAAEQRTHAQLMADELVTRVTGVSEPDKVPVRVNLVMTDVTLFRGDGEPGLVPGFGPVPAGWAREQVGTGQGAVIRRLYTAPGVGTLVAMDSKSREVPDGLAEFIALRDQGSCRVPWCDAPIRHLDHVVPVVQGGRTCEQDLQGLCEAHNYAKQAPGWQMVPSGGALAGTGHQVEIRTPSGQILRSRAPAPPGTRPGREAGDTGRQRDRRRDSARSAQSGGPSP